MQTQFRSLLLAAGIALALGSSTAVMAAGPVSQEVTDARQESQIMTTFALSPYLRAHELQASAHGGKVVLTGKVDGDVNKDLAKQIALGVKGVTEVDNRIVVVPDYTPSRHGTERSFGEVIDDASITAAVKSTFLYSSNVDGSDIEVTTRGGIVTLSGKVSGGAERELAIELAQNVRGVKSVQAKGLTI